MKFHIPSRTFFRIGDVAEILGVKPYVIRFWESEFPFLAPDKAASGQRVYRRPQIESLIFVKHLLHVERYSIEGAKKKLTELRRQSKLKEAMTTLIEVGSLVDKADVAMPVESGDQPSAQESANTEAVKAKFEELQKLIRDPEAHGVKVPGLK